jgi:hypothetical protein
VFEDKNNLIGLALLVLCGLSAGTMLGYIKAGEIARYTGPPWLGVVIVVAGIAVTAYMTAQHFRGQQLGDDTRERKRRWWRREK